MVKNVSTNGKHIVFFTGAGMSAESGVPTYRGTGGIWDAYRWDEYACEKAFQKHPEKVLDFHEVRRQAILKCQPHDGHRVIQRLSQQNSQVDIVTQNIDGMHQRSGCSNVIELHGNIWRMRCPQHGIFEDFGETYRFRRCEICGSWLRPDVIWFGDMLNEEVIQKALASIAACDLFISIGTSGTVWPAAGFPQFAREHKAYCIEINPAASEISPMYDEVIRERAGKALAGLFE